MSNELRMPLWWKEAIAIEYLPCRDFTKGDRLGEIDLSLISEQQFDNAFQTWNIVAYGCIIHNTDRATFQNRLLTRLFSSVSRPIVDQDSTAIIPHGLVAQYNFPFLANPINVCDPIETFNAHIQVLDDGKLYQWEIARFEGVENRHYGRWVSDYVDLTDFDSTYDEFNQLLWQKKQMSDIGEYIILAEQYIKKLREFRQKAFTELLNVHEDFKKRDQSSKTKITQVTPPILSRFETMQIKNGEIYTACYIAPAFYRATLKHCRDVQEMAHQYSSQPIFILDQFYETLAQSVIMAIACLEAVVNEIGHHKYSEIWGSLEKLSLKEKINLLHYFSPSAPSLDLSQQPFQFIIKIISIRNDMIHFKGGYSKCKTLNGVAISKMEMMLNKEVSEKLPTMLEDAIKTLYAISELPEPVWLKNQPGWKI